jgi:hypothetical protein
VLAILSLVCGLTCCLFAPAIILGIIAIFRTTGGKAKGLWMAITGIVLGVIGALVIGAIGVGLSQVEGWDDPESLTPGECFDSGSAVSDDSEAVGLVDRTSCATPHDAEVVAAWTVDSTAEGNRLETGDPWEHCLAHADPKLKATLESNPDPKLVMSFLTWDPEAIKAGDAIMCYAYRDEGQLTGSLVQQGIAG